MNINEIKSGMSNVSISGKVISVGEPREVMTRYGKKRVADAMIQDDTGEIGLSLWEGQIETVKPGSSVTVTGAYVSEFREKIQLNIPKSGSIQVEEE